MTRASLLAMTLGALGWLPSQAAANAPSGRAYPEAEKLFHQDPNWLGSDGGYSVPLGSGRTLWLFGGTVIKVGPRRDIDG